MPNLLTFFLNKDIISMWNLFTEEDNIEVIILGEKEYETTK